MSSHEQLTDLLVRWQDALEQGRDLSATELCAGDTALLPELEQRIADLRRLSRLAVEIGRGVAQTSDPGAPAGETVSLLASPARLPQVPDYEVLREVGRGGMGVVYEARDLRLKRTVALKLLRHGNDATTEQRARFRAEAEAIARLHHPHIVQVFHAGQWQASEDGAPLPFFAMEFVSGGCLARIAQEGPQPPADVARLVLLLARAVHAAHQAGVIHRDLKPNNVLLASPADEPALNTIWGCPKVSDFGLARLGEPGAATPVGQTASGALLGTPAYMPPEQVEGRSQEIGPASDIWALGVMLYQLLTGHCPFRSDSSMRIMQKICDEEPPAVRSLRPEVPVALAAIVERCLRKVPAERYPSAAALADDLKRFLAGEPTDATPARAPRPKQRKPRASIALRLSLGCWEFILELKRRRPMMAALALVASAVLVFSGAFLTTILIPSVQLVRDKAPGPGLQPAHSGWIDILVSDPKNERRRGLRLHEPGARPLRPGDEVRVEVALKERPGYVYVVWIDAKGKAIPIYPWQDFVWDRRPQVEKPLLGRLILPEDGTVYPIEPSPEGVETLLMLVRDTPLPAGVDVGVLLGDLGEQTGTDREYVRWFENGAVVTSEPDRAPGGAVQASDPAERTQALIRQRLGEHFQFSRAVSFFNLGQR
jgi:serine/threonine protein kinase